MNRQKNNFLLTGGTGFIGSNLARELVKKGNNVSIIVSKSIGKNSRIKDIESKLNIYECNLQSESLKPLVAKIKPDFIFHLASYGVPPEEDSVLEMIDSNLKGTINLIEAAKQSPFKLFINTGSCVEYGLKEEDMRETDMLEPINNYGILKSATTLYCQKEAIRNNLPIINFRLFSTYGYSDQEYRLIPSVITSAIVNEPIKVSSPTNVRDFIFIEDVISAYLHSVEVTVPRGEIFNIGSGMQHSIEEIVKLCLTISKSKSKVQWGALSNQKRSIEPLRWQADISKTKKSLNWKPETSIEEGLRKTIEWYRKNSDIYN